MRAPPQRRRTHAGADHRFAAAAAACTHDLFAVAAEFGDTAVDTLRTVLACYEALRATEDHAPAPSERDHATEA
jgi:hypothetical protein